MIKDDRRKVKSYEMKELKDGMKGSGTEGMKMNEGKREGMKGQQRSV